MIYLCVPCSRVRPLYYPVVPYARNIWSYWTDAVIEMQNTFGFVSVAIFSGNGVLNMATNKFIPTSADIRVSDVILKLMKAYVIISNSSALIN